MSYDTSIKIDTGRGELYEVDDSINMTSNVGEMYRAAMPGPYEGGGKYDGTGDVDPRGGLTGLSGLKCSEVFPIISAGVQYMLENADEMRKLEPDNGWGDYDGALAYLQAIQKWCAAHPNGILCVNWYVE